jgi:hypothetical protein
MENMFDSGALVSGSFDIGAVDYSGSNVDPGTAYPTSVLDGGGISPAWDQLFRGSIAKGLDYFIAKDAYETRAGLPGGYPATYYRGADGRLYQSNGMPVGGVTMQGQASGNGMLLLILLGAVLLLRKG